ncbi:MAG: hypothetical protein K6T66_15370 [Peptococcaceae bacterium]|nr:hypothetical protein [Peptococcaceae bacterium]
MQDYLQCCHGKFLHIEISGGKNLDGILIDSGPDTAVLYDGQKFFYLSLNHIQRFKKGQDLNSDFEGPSGICPIDTINKGISFRQTIENAKGLFIELYVTGNQTIHGYIENIFSDYLLFNSHFFKTMIIPTEHLKWLSIQNRNQTFFTLNKKDMLVHSFLSISASSEFNMQLSKLKGNIVIFNMGTDQNQMGLLKKIEGCFAELILADEKSIIHNIKHIKTVHLP